MKTHFVMMANYNEWANARVFRMAGTLGDGTLNHLLVADRIWMHRLTGMGTHPEKLDAILFQDLPSLHAARIVEDRRIITFVQSLDEPDFEAMWDYRTLTGTSYRQPRREILAHLFNHETHHRGQAHAILTGLGVAEPEPLDLLLMQRALRGALRDEEGILEADGYRFLCFPPSRHRQMTARRRQS
jgi:uncharacterized damage-inducible protein DinB